MYRQKSKSIFLSAGLSIAVVLLGSTVSRAQSPSPAAAETSGSGYEVTSTVEIGVRGIEVNGVHEKYRSDLNYRNGFRLFDSSIYIQDKTSGYKLFDTALINATGWGGDPAGSFRLNLDKLSIYKLDSNVRRVKYFNNLKTHVTNPYLPVSTYSQRTSDTVHHFGDIDLTVFPQRENFRMRFGYSFNNTEGPGGATLRFQGDEYGIDSAIRTRADDLRFGVEGQLLGFNLGATYGHRNFKDRTRFFENSFNPGNSPYPQTTLPQTSSYLDSAERRFEVKGTTDFVNFFVQRTFANKLDFTGRVIYAESRSRSAESDLLAGRAGATGTTTPVPGIFIISDEIFIGANAKRPQTRADLGLTYRVTRDFRISNTFTFDQFNTGGGNQLNELVVSTTATGAPRPNTFTSSTAWRTESYRRFSNLIEADWQVRNWLAFNVGYRFTNRRVNGLGRDINLVTGVVTPRGGDEHENQTHSIIAGTKIKPVKNWSIFADFEHGQADNVFTRLANNDFLNFRIRSIARLKQLTFNLSAIAREGDSPGRSTAFTGSVPFPSIDTVSNSKSQIYSASLDWTPRTDLTLSGGYTYNRQTGRATIIVPVGVPIFSSTRFLEGISEYYVRDNNFYFDVNARPFKRLSVYAAYRISDDAGQGDRVATRPQDFITSYPMRFQSPEVRIAIKLTRNIDWNVGYQYYDYSETPIGYPFSSIRTSGTTVFPVIPQIFPAQNYTAHLPYTSLRIYFGRSAADR